VALGCGWLYVLHSSVNAKTQFVAACVAPAVPEHVAQHHAKLAKVKTILSGETPINMYLDFLYR
jgi:hypothetical protein